MNILKLFRKELTKREKVTAMLKNLAMIADMPKEMQIGLNDLDMTVATDQQVDVIYNGLVALNKQLEEIRKKHGRDLFEIVKENPSINNFINNN